MRDPAWPWHEWICHSNFSFLIGASHPEDYVREALMHGYKSLAITDYDGVYGLAKAYQAHKNSPDDLNLFYGSEFHLADDHDQPILLRDTVVLLAVNRQGYNQICRLATEAHKESKREPVLALDTLLALNTKDLICLQPMRGPIRQSQFNGERYALLKESFGANFHLIISRHLNPLEDRWIKPTLDWAKRLSVPLLFSQDCYFHAPYQKDLSDVVQAIRLNKSLDDAIPHLFVNEERCFRSLDILKQRYSVIPDHQTIVENSQRLAERFDFSLNELKYKYPQEFLPTGYDSQDYLDELVWKSAGDRNPNGFSSHLYGLLKTELKLIEELGYADYFITVWDIVRWARSQKILCQGRGSAANSAICYVLGITSIDPNQHNMVFERFLNRERGDPPDIDVDFEHERREEVIQYIYRRYGRHRAAMVANVITFRTRGAMRAVGKALGFQENWIEQAAEKKSRRFDRPDPGDKAWPHSEREDEDEDSGPSPYDWELWQELAERLKGFPRHLGIHSGGFIITNEALDDLCPQEPATMPGRTVVQWSKEDIENLGMFKIDILALGMLSALRKCFDTMRSHFQADHCMATLPVDCPKTYAMIQRAETVGVFQIESRAQMSMLPRLLPNKFYDLVVQIGIIRPGPIQGGLIHPYLQRRRGLEPVEFPHEVLKPELARTLGVPLFQEQIMRIAIKVGGFTGGEADELRKKIGSWSTQKNLGGILARLEEGMRTFHIEQRFIDQTLGHLQGFANYGFPESHAVSFALLAYASAYIKCHFPEAFYMALLNSQPMGFYSIHALIQSARREGLLFLPPDVNYSLWDCSLEDIPPLARQGTKARYAIRMGFRLINSLSQKGAEELLQHRKEPWSNLQSFLQSNRGMNRRDLTALAAANSLQNFALDRRQALWLAESLPLAPLLDNEWAYQFGQENDLQRLEQDFNAFSTTLGQHPCLILKEQAWIYDLPLRRIIRAIDLKTQKIHASVHVFGLILIRQAPETAKNMMFITLEDETGFVNLICRPAVIEKYRDLIEVQGFLCIQGRVQKDQQSLSVLVEHVLKPDPDRRRIIPLVSKGPREPEQIRHLPPVRNFR